MQALSQLSYGPVKGAVLYRPRRERVKPHLVMDTATSGRQKVNRIGHYHRIHLLGTKIKLLDTRDQLAFQFW